MQRLDRHTNHDGTVTNIEPASDAKERASQHEPCHGTSGGRVLPGHFIPRTTRIERSGDSQ